MTLKTPRSGPEQVTVAAVEELARQQIAPYAAVADAEFRFPTEGVGALVDGGLLALQDSSLSTTELTTIGRTLARACGSTAMIWAMHHVQVACTQRHCNDDPVVLDALTRLSDSGGLVASVTSEVGVGGEMMRSITSVSTDGAISTVTKDAPTVSYGAQAGAFLITARRAPDSAPGDQVAVLAEKEQVTLTPKGTWAPMGMRGTSSPAFLVEAAVPSSYVLPVPFADIAGQTMVPLSHILWSSVWLGLAEEALVRATTYVRGKRSVNTLDAERSLAAAELPLRLVRSLLQSVVGKYDEHTGPSFDPDFSVELNDLKVAASTRTVESVQISLEILGMAGFQEQGPLSVTRILRDLYSARLMIANQRLIAANGTMTMLNRSRPFTAEPGSKRA